MEKNFEKAEFCGKLTSSAGQEKGTLEQLLGSQFTVSKE